MNTILSAESEPNEALEDKQSQQFFPEAFGDEDGTGLRVVLERLRFGRRITEALISFMTNRLEMEEEYAKRLHRMSQFSLPFPGSFYENSNNPKDSLTHPHNGNDYSLSVRAAADSLSQSCSSQAEGHSKLCELIRNRILRPLESSLRAQFRTKNFHKEEMLRLVKAKIQHSETAAIRQERAKKKTATLERLMTIDLGPEPNPKTRLRHQEAVEMAIAIERGAISEWKQAAQRTSEAHRLWTAQLQKALRDFEIVERQRLRISRKILMIYGNVFGEASGNALKISLHLCERISMSDVDDEIFNFCQTYGKSMIQDPFESNLAAPLTNSYQQNFATSEGGCEFKSSTMSRKSFRNKSELDGKKRVRKRDRLAHFFSQLRISKSTGSGKFDVNSGHPQDPLDLAERGTRAEDDTLSNTDPYHNNKSPIPADYSRNNEDNSFQFQEQQPTCPNQNQDPAVHHTNYAEDRSILSSPNIEQPSSSKTNVTQLPRRARVLFKYKAKNPDEISLRRLDVVLVQSTHLDPWWFGTVIENDLTNKLKRQDISDDQVSVTSSESPSMKCLPVGRSGLFPSNYVEWID